MGEDTTYSGTVAGAMEGALHGIDSIAISQFINDKYGEDSKIAKRDFSLATDFIVKLAKDILDKKYIIGTRKFLNINIPPLKKEKCKGVKITQLGYRDFNATLDSYTTPRGHKIHWMGINPYTHKERDNSKNPHFQNNLLHGKLEVISDFKALELGYISITPMHLDLTSYEDIKPLQNLDFRI